LHVTKSPRPSPSRICMLQAIKYWRWEQPGNEARVFVFPLAAISHFGGLWQYSCHICVCWLGQTVI